jgi:hypothetical protein
VPKDPCDVGHLGEIVEIVIGDSGEIPFRGHLVF